jgi:hypothetical protein
MNRPTRAPSWCVRGGGDCSRAPPMGSSCVYAGAPNVRRSERSANDRLHTASAAQWQARCLARHRHFSARHRLTLSYFTLRRRWGHYVGPPLDPNQLIPEDRAALTVYRWDVNNGICGPFPAVWPAIVFPSATPLVVGALRQRIASPARAGQTRWARCVERPLYCSPSARSWNTVT